MSEQGDKQPVIPGPGAKEAARHTRRRGLRWLVASPVLLALFYLAGFNLLLNAGWAQAWLDRRLPEVTLAWSSGWSAWPGQLRLHDLTIRHQAAGSPLFLAVDEADLRIAPEALIARRLSVRRLEADGIRRLAFGPHRLQGDGALHLEQLRLGADRVSAGSLRLSLVEGSLWREGLLLAEALTLDTELSVAPFSPANGLDRQRLRQLSGDLRLAARADARDVFTPYLQATPWLSLAGRGDLTADLSLLSGELAPGSRMSLDSPTLAVTLDERALLGGAPGETATDGNVSGPGSRYRLAGSGRAELSVATGDRAPSAELDLVLDDVTMQPLDDADPAPLLTSRHFAVSARLASADLTADPPLDSARLAWQAAEVPDVGRLSGYLPPGSPLQLHAGTARLDARFHYRHGRLDGDLDLSGDEVALSLLGRRLLGELALNVSLAELDPLTPRLDLSGTRLRVVARQAADERPLITELALPEARFTARRPLTELADHAAPLPVDGRLAVSGRVTHLGVLNAFLENAFDERGMTLDGEGELAATLVLDNGLPTIESQLAIVAPTLAARFLDFRAQGRGRLTAQLREVGDTLGAALQLHLDEARLTHGHDPRPLLVAPRLNLTAVLDELDTAPSRHATTLHLAWPTATVPDVAVLGQHLPEAAPLGLLGGRAESRGELTLDASGLSGQLALSGRALRARLLDTEVAGEISLALPLRHASLDGRRLDLSGARLEWQVDSDDAAQRLTTVLLAREARFDHLFGNTGTPRSRLILDGLVDRLGFLDRFLPAAHGVSVRGVGSLQAELDLLGRMPRPGSRLQVNAEQLAVTFLDYRASGNGRLEARLDGHPEAPGARLVLSLPQLTLGRRDGSAAYLSGRHFRLETATPYFALDPQAIPLASLTTRIELPIAEVTDLAAYNAYLPQGSGLALLAGRASLTAELDLEGQHARGELSLQAFDASLRLGEQHLQGNLQLDARLREGDLETLTFDAAGTRLRLDNVSHEGRDGRQERGWWAQLELEEGQLTWQQPLSLDARLALAMRDTGLLVNLMLADSREHPWLGRLLTVTGIAGSTELRLADDSLHLHDLRLTGRDLEMLADLRLAGETVNGVLYVRFGPLRLGVELQDGGRDLHLFRPRRWYDSTTEARRQAPRPPPEPGWLDAIEATPRQEAH
jgi:translocation and assembly module TamB